MAERLINSSRSIPAVTLVLLFFNGCLLLPGSHRGSDEHIATQPVPIAGSSIAVRINSKNGRTRCEFNNVDTQRYQVTCQALVALADGSELRPNGVDDGVHLSWAAPQVLDSVQAATDCKVDPYSLSQSCDVRLIDSQMASIRFDLAINDSHYGDTVESDTVNLPYSVSTYGQTLQTIAYRSLADKEESPLANAVSSLLGVARLLPGADETLGVFQQLVSAMGFQNQKKNQFDFPLPDPNSMCEVGGVVYFSASNHVYRLESTGITLFAGATSSIFVYDFSHRLRVTLTSPLGISCAEDAIYATDAYHDRVLKLSMAGPVNLVADGLKAPQAVASDRDGTVYIADTQNNRVLAVDKLGAVTTVTTDVSSPKGLAMGKDGSLYISDTYNHRIRKVSPSGTITSVAGINSSGFSGDGGLATAAALAFPIGLALGENGELYIADTGNHRIRKVNSTGIISTVVGTGMFGFSGDGGSALTAQVRSPVGLVLSKDVLYVADLGNYRIRSVSGGIISTVAGRDVSIDNGDGGPAVLAKFRAPSTVIVGPDGSIVIFDLAENRIRKIDSNGATVETILADAQVASPWGGAFDSNGNLYIAEASNHRIRKVTPGGMTSTIAGLGTPGFSGDGGPAMDALLNLPGSLGIASDDSIYFADTGNGAVRKIDPAGNISTVGIGFSQSLAIAVASDGTLFVSDLSAKQLYRILSFGAKESLSVTGLPISYFGRIALDGDDILMVGGVNIGEPSSRIFKLSPAGGLTYLATSFFGGYQPRDCSNFLLQGKAKTPAEAEAAIRPSLSLICPGSVISLTTQNRCTVDKKKSTVFGLALSLGVFQSSVLVKITQPCE